MKKTHFRYFFAILALVFAACSSPTGIETVHSISLSHTEHTFNSAQVGYDTQDSVTVTVTNTGNQATGALSVTTSADSFTLSTSSLNSISVGGSATFTVRPSSGLGVGTHTATVLVLGSNGIIAQVNKRFTVNAVVISDPTYINSLDIHITAPAKGETPASAITVTGAVNFTAGTVSWSPDDSPFQGEVAYTATVTLTANSDYTFNGLYDAKVDGKDAVIVSNEGETVTLSYTFPETLAKAVTGIAIKTQPSNLTYTHGEELNLTGLEVTLTYDDTSTENVASVNFINKGITTLPTHGDTLSRSENNGKPVTVEQGHFTVNTNNLTVNKAPAPNITWAVSTTITYGNELFTSVLSGGSTEYGSFAWTNGAIIPTVTNSGYSVTFTPNQDTLANYETITQTTNTISITVNKANGATVSGIPTVIGTPTVTSITVNAVSNTSGNGQTVQYAISTLSGTTPTSGWQTETPFTSLNLGTTYYVYARTAENDNYLAGEAKVSVGITTPSQGNFAITFETIANNAPIINGPITISQSGSRAVVVDMYDSYGDGWNGNGALRINVNGVQIANNVKVQTTAANNNPSGQRYNNTYTFNVNQGDEVEFYWVAGSYQDENSFIVYYADTSPSPAFTSSNNNNWSGSNALLYRLRNATTANGGLSDATTNQSLGSFTGTGDIQSRTATLTVSNPDDYTTIEWYYGGTLLNTTPTKQASLTLDVADIRYNEVGTHNLTLWVIKDGKVYSRTIPFTVY